MKATYTGHLSVTYMDYTDLETGRTLQVEPGGVYDISPAIPPENFIPVTGKKKKKIEELMSPLAEESAPEVKENNV